MAVKIAEKDIVRKMSKKKLEQEINIMRQQIELCFGSRDVTYLDMLEREAERRGYTLHETVELI